MARIAGVNIPQNKLVKIGLTYIYGIGDKFSNDICKALSIPNDKRVNQLTDDEILKIREFIDKNFTVEGDLSIIELTQMSNLPLNGSILSRSCWTLIESLSNSLRISSPGNGVSIRWRSPIMYDF